MSNYRTITRHPVDRNYENAEWLDDYFGPHKYGVKFKDGKVYPAEQVRKEELKTFWAADVIETLEERGWERETIVKFLNDLNKTYKRRWKRDPVQGEGATAWAESIINGGRIR